MTPATQECHPSGSYVAIFSSIHYVLKAEQLLKQGGIALDVVPVPREISGDCGMAVTFAPAQVAPDSVYPGCGRYRHCPDFLQGSGR